MGGNAGTKKSDTETREEEGEVTKKYWNLASFFCCSVAPIHAGRGEIFHDTSHLISQAEVIYYVGSNGISKKV